MIICWWSGGITSAVACKKAIEIYGKENCRVIMMDTHNEHEDTYRFRSDCSKWYGVEIETISAIGDKYESIEDVWRTHLSLNIAKGAVCSDRLKAQVRLKWQKENDYSAQVFGFEFDSKEFKRALSMKLNHEIAKPIFPLMMLGIDKDDCIRIVKDAGIDIPAAYRFGFRNNNCLNTGCIQGGVGYWQKMRDEHPGKFESMAKLEHELTNKKGEAVTMLKDQSKAAKESGNYKVFLLKHPDYPELKELSDMKGRPVEPLSECNGFCGVNDLIKKSSTEMEVNFEG